MYNREEIEEWLDSIGFAKIYPNKDCWGYRAKDDVSSVCFDGGRVNLDIKHADGIVVVFSTMYPTIQVIKHAWVTVTMALKVAVDNDS